MDLYRPLCEISDNDLLSRLKALSAQGMTEDEIAKTQEGQERYLRSLTDMQIIDICNQKMSQPGMTLSDIPEFSERVRRRNLPYEEACAQLFNKQEDEE